MPGTIPSQTCVHWFEIPVSDLERAKSLYGAALGMELRHEIFFGVPHAIFVRKDDAPAGGTLVHDPKRSPRVGTGTVIYLHASDGVEVSLARAVAAGARVIQEATSVGPFGTVALFEDHDGNLVGLHAPGRFRT